MADDGGRKSGGRPARPGAEARVPLENARSLQSAAVSALSAAEAGRTRARQAFEAVRHDSVRHQLSAMSVSRLKETTEGRLRLGAVEAAGYCTVGDVLSAGPYRLQQLPGVGHQTATQVVAAAACLRESLEQHVRVRFDPVERPDLQARLLAGLAAHDVADQAVSPLRSQLEELTRSLDQLTRHSDLASGRLKLLFAVAPRLLERGRRDVGQWPPGTAEAFMERLDALIATETDPAEQGRLRRLKEAAVEVSKGVVAGATVAAGQWAAGQ